MRGRPLGVYIHFPWCLSKCPYCDFFSVATQNEIPHDAYADAVIDEFKRRIDALEPATLRSIYFGGGTPSLWNADALGRVIRQVLSTFDYREERVEITIECNPSSFNAERCSKWQDVGVNRLSLGLQSLSDESLKYLGRAHNAREGLTALKLAVASGTQSVGADLIFGLPGRSVEQAVSELRQLPLANLAHLSVYALTIEKNTPFGALARAGRLPVVPDDLVADTFVALHDELTACGFEHYEISNYARAGYQSVHNSGYWQGLDYLGLGVAAWGTVRVAGDASLQAFCAERVRYRNTTRIQRYLERHERARSDSLWWLQPTGLLTERETIDDVTALSERMMLGLRTQAGVNLAELAEAFDVGAWLLPRERTIDKLVERKRLLREDSTLRIPFETWFLADGTIAELI